MKGVTLDKIESRFAVFLPALGTLVEVKVENMIQMLESDLDAIPERISTASYEVSECSRYKKQKAKEGSGGGIRDEKTTVTNDHE